MSAPDAGRPAPARVPRILTRTYRPHLYLYLVVNAGLTGLNVYLGAPWWAVWPLVLWGMLLMLHFLYYRTASVNDAWVDERTLDLRSKSYDMGHIDDIRKHPAPGIKDEGSGSR